MQAHLVTMVPGGPSQVDVVSRDHDGESQSYWHTGRHPNKRCHREATVQPAEGEVTRSDRMNNEIILQCSSPEDARSHLSNNILSGHVLDLAIGGAAEVVEQ